MRAHHFTASLVSEHGSCLECSGFDTTHLLGLLDRLCVLGWGGGVAPDSCLTYSEYASGIHCTVIIIWYVFLPHWYLRAAMLLQCTCIMHDFLIGCTLFTADIAGLVSA